MRLFRSINTFKLTDLSPSFRISPILQLTKLASYKLNRIVLPLTNLKRRALPPRRSIQSSFFITMASPPQRHSLILVFEPALSQTPAGPTFFLPSFPFQCWLPRFFPPSIFACIISLNEIDLISTGIRVNYNILIGTMNPSILLFLVLFITNVTSIVDRTYFNYLGLKISATPQEIKMAYQQKKDKIEGLSDENEKDKKFKLLNEAFQTLSNENQRQKYERYGKDIFKTIKEMTCINKMNPDNPRDERKSPSFKLTVPVSIEDIYHGSVVKAKFPKQTACPICQGTGAKMPKDIKPCSACAGKGFSLREEQNFYGQRFPAETICPVCRGSGKTVTKSCDSCKGTKLINKMETIEIPIPKGLPNGNKITLRNLGEESLLGAPSDFEITIVEVPTEKWSREGNNLIYKMEIDLEESLFGFTKSFQHLDGSLVTVDRLNHVTAKDTKHLIKERGLINNKGVAGNLIVTFKVTIPKFTDEQLNMWEDFFYEHPM